MFATARVLLVVGLVGVAAWAVTTRPAAENLLKNASFETPGPFGQIGAPDEWEGAGMGTFPAVAQDCTVAHEGRCSLKIMSDKFVLASVLQTVKLKPDQLYRFTGWVKTKLFQTHGPADMYGALVVLPNNLNQDAQMSKSDSHGGTTDWTEISVEFRADSTGVMTAMCNYCGQGAGKGIMWFDDLHLVPIDKLTPASASAPASETGHAGRPTTQPSASHAQ